MQTTPLHMLGTLLGIQNYTPPTETTAHFSFERQANTYMLDAALTTDILVLCLSRALLPHEEQDTDFLEAAARIAHAHAPIEAFHQNAHICFVERIPLNSMAHTDMHVLEQSLDTCFTCHEALREI